VFDGIGVFVRPDTSIWIFDRGDPLFIRRTSRWKSVALDSFVRWVADLAGTSAAVADVFARAVLRVSIQGSGGIFGITSDPSSLDDTIAPRDMVPATTDVPEAASTVDDDLHFLLAGPRLGSSASLARLARLDGATVVDREGVVLAYGAILRSADNRGEGARTAAARALSLRADLAVSVSQDGPVTVFQHGAVVLELL